MKVILYAAVTIDGFIATKDGNSEWVSDVDIKIFNRKIKEFGCIILGNKTYKQFKGEYFPKKDALNIVISKNPPKERLEDVVFATTPIEALKVAEEQGFKQVLLIGGGITNASFLKLGLVDEMFLDVHPLIFGEGIKIFKNIELNSQVTLIDTQELGSGQTLLHYSVK